MSNKILSGSGSCFVFFITNMSGEHLVSSDNSVPTENTKKNNNNSKNSSSEDSLLIFADEHNLLNNYGPWFYILLTTGCISTVLGIVFFAQTVPWCKMSCSNRFRGLLCNRHSSSFHPNTSLLLSEMAWGEEIDSGRGICLSEDAALKTNFSENIEKLCVCKSDILELNDSMKYVVDSDDNRLKVIEDTINILKNQQDYIKNKN